MLFVKKTKIVPLTKPSKFPNHTYFFNLMPCLGFFTNSKSYGFVRSKLLTIYIIDKILYLSLLKKV